MWAEKVKAMSDSEKPKDNTELGNVSGLDPVSTIVTEKDRHEDAEELAQLIRQMAKGGSIAFIGSAIGKVANLGLNVLLGRRLGTGAYGLYVLGTSVIGIGTSVASLGLTQGVVRYGAMYHGEADKARIKGTIVSALQISLTCSVVLASVLFICARLVSERVFNEPGLTNVLRILSLALPFYVLTGITAAFAQSFKRIEYQQGINLFHAMTNLGLVGVAFLLGFRLAGAMCGFLASGVLSAGLGLYFLVRIFPDINSVVKATYQSTQLLRFSLPMLFIGFSHLSLNYTDRIMLGYFRKSSDVAVYNAASVLARTLTIFLVSFAAIFSPIISDLDKKGHHDELAQLYKIVMKWLFDLTLPFLLILSIFSKSLLHAFGIQFTSGYLALIILALSRFLSSTMGPTSKFLQMRGKQNIDLTNAIGLVFANIVLNMALIPRFGIEGAALATCVSIASINTLRLAETYKIYHVLPYDKRLSKVIAPACTAILVGTACANFVSSHWVCLLLGPISMAVSYFLVRMLHGFDQEDILVLNAIRVRIF